MKHIQNYTFFGKNLTQDYFKGRVLPPDFLADLFFFIGTILYIPVEVFGRSLLVTTS